MASYTLTPERRAEYAKRFDFRSQFVRAARQILAAGGIDADGIGSGNQQVPRTYTSVDFAAGAATGVKAPVALGDRRYYEYSQFLGVLTIMNTAPIETVPEAEDAYITADHQRELDERVATERVLFMEHLEPFTAALLPWLDVQELIPIDPDERPVQDREINVAYLRYRVKFEIRYAAWPAE
jgi:hypothetical protein